MAIPDFQTLMLPVLRRIAEGVCRTADLVPRLSDDFGLSEDQREQLLPSARQTTIANRVHWAVSYLFRADLLRRTGRGEYEATEGGRAVLRDPPERITIGYLAQISPRFAEFRRGEDAAASAPDTGPAPMVAEPVAPAQTPDDAIAAAMTQIEQALRRDLLDQLLASTPDFFEYAVLQLLLGMGYGDGSGAAGEKLGRTGDGGVDGVIREDRLGLDVIYIQAKRYTDNPITTDHLRSFAGALADHGARKGVFITTSRFTRDAEEFARRQQQVRIVLLDGAKLTDLMIRHNIGVRERRSITLKQLDEEFFTGEIL